MERKYSNPEEALNVAHEAMWLAWQASSCVGLGFLQDKPEATKEQVVASAFHKDRPADGYGDYIFGRMMKTSFKVKENTLQYSDGAPRYDYQSWAGRYRLSSASRA